MFPTSVKHNSNGRYVSILGDGEYVIYTAMKLRNKTFGTGQQLVWSSVATGDYAVRAGSEVHVYREFKESKTIRLVCGWVSSILPLLSDANIVPNALGAVNRDPSKHCVYVCDWTDMGMLQCVVVVSG